jgi:DNA-directed RNA polymerase specialized sigma24 family protein
VDRAAALEQLPDAYAVALRLRDGGADDDAIAATVGVARAAVRSLLAIGERKLAEVLAQTTGSPASSDARSRRPAAPSLE